MMKLLLMITAMQQKTIFGAQVTELPENIYGGESIIPRNAYNTVMKFFDTKSALRSVIEKCPMDVQIGKIKIHLDKNGLSASKIDNTQELQSISLAKTINDDIATLQTDEAKAVYCKEKLKNRLFDATSTFSSDDIDIATNVKNRANTQKGTDFKTREAILDSGIMALEKLQDLCKVDESTIMKAQTKMLKRLDLISMDQPDGILPCAWNFCINNPNWSRLTYFKIAISILVAIEIIRNTVSRFNISKETILRRKPRRIELQNEGEKPVKQENSKLTAISYIISVILIIVVAIPNVKYQEVICGAKNSGP